jgi:hypothetical protein
MFPIMLLIVALVLNVAFAVSGYHDKRFGQAMISSAVSGFLAGSLLFATRFSH